MKRNVPSTFMCEDVTPKMEEKKPWKAWQVATITAVITFVLSIVFSYVVLSFFELSLNPAKWVRDTRYTFAFICLAAAPMLTIFSFPASAIFYQEFVKENN